MSQKTKRFTKYIIANLIAFSIIWYWLLLISEQGRQPSGDGPHILGTATRLAQMLVDFNIGEFLKCFSSLLGPHPPFAYLPFVGAELIAPNKSWTHLVGGVIVLFISWDGIRRIGGGVIGLIWLMAATPIWLQAENAGIDLVAGACVIQSLSHLAKSDELQNKYHVMLWGGWMGAAFMCKYTAPLFLWAPCIIAGWWVVRRNQWKRLMQGIIGFGIIAIPWWSTHLNQVMGYVTQSSNAKSGLLTNKMIVTGNWYDIDNLTWYPATVADAIGWSAIAIITLSFILPKKNRYKGSLICLFAIVGGWFILNQQTQRQDRYLLPLFPIAAAVIGRSRLAVPSLLIAVPLIQQTKLIYTADSHKPYNCPIPAERNYKHKFLTKQNATSYAFLSDTSMWLAGKSWACPSTNACNSFSEMDDKWNTTSGSWNQGDCPDQSYWPVNLSTTDWELKEALEKTRKYHESDHGTVGFLLQEEGGAPKFGSLLREATKLGYRWHIATVNVVRFGPHQMQQKDRKLASVFVGPFTIGDWPSRDFDVLLVLQVREDELHEKWIKSTGMELVEEWTPKKYKKARIYKTPD